MKKFYYLAMTLMVAVLLSSTVSAQLATSVRGEDGPWTDENNGFDWNEDAENPLNWVPGQEVEMLIDGFYADSSEYVTIMIGFFSMTQGWTFYEETNVTLDSIPAAMFTDGYYATTLTLPADLPTTEVQKAAYGDDTDFYMIQAKDALGYYANTVCVIEEGEIVQMPIATSVRGEDGPWTDENNGFDWNEDPENPLNYAPGDEIEMMIAGLMGTHAKIHIGWFSMTQGWTFYEETNVPLDSIPVTMFVDGYYTTTLTLPADLPTTEARKAEYGDDTDFYMIQALDKDADGVTIEGGYANTVLVIEEGGSTSVKQISLEAMNIYPNPVMQGNPVTVNTEGLIEVYNITGARVLTSETSTFYTDELKTGMYFVKAGGMKAAKLIVK